MGALPKRKISTRRKGKRRAAQKLTLPTLVVCQKCGEKKLPHMICQNCGTYSKNENAA